MELINLIPQSTELDASPTVAGKVMFDGVTLVLNDQDQLSLGVGVDADSAISFEDNKYDVKLQDEGGLAKDENGNLYVDWSLNGTNVVAPGSATEDYDFVITEFNKMTVIDIEDTTKQYVIGLPDIATATVGQEFEVFINDDYNKTTFSDYKIVFDSGYDTIKIKIAGDIQDSNGRKVIANTAQALVGFKVLSKLGNKYWLASGNCGKDPLDND